MLLSDNRASISMFWLYFFQCSIILVVKGSLVLICSDEVVFSMLLKQIPDMKVIYVNATDISLKFYGAPRSCLCVAMVTSSL